MDGQYLRYLRKYCLRLTQNKMADKLGLSVRALQQYEAGERADGTPVEIPRYIELAAAALMLGISDFSGTSMQAFCAFVIQVDDTWYVQAVDEEIGTYPSLKEAMEAAANEVNSSGLYDTAVVFYSNGKITPINLVHTAGTRL